MKFRSEAEVKENSATMRLGLRSLKFTNLRAVFVGGVAANNGLFGTKVGDEKGIVDWVEEFLGGVVTC